MCGICGLVSFGFNPGGKKEIVKKMSDAMTHRGPDHYGSIEFESAALGMRRLSIIDLSRAGNQPICNEDKSLWCVCNGEIYNYQELRESLIKQGHIFKSGSDTEVIIHLYEEIGSDCVNLLRGMFVFAIWDENKKELFLARDRLGIKPVYYIQSSNKFVFASEINAIKNSRLFDLELNYSSVDHYLSFGYVPPPETMFKEIKMLLPGSYVQLSSKGINIDTWWRFPEQGSIDCESQEIVPTLRGLLEDSIRLHQISDVPTGAFLSGGIDSTAVVGLMSKISKKPIKTFSIGFDSHIENQFNELDLAKIVSNRFKTDHSEIIINSQDVIDHIDHYIDSLDQPSFDGINTYFVSQAAKNGGLTVALSGLGGDELFGGYGSYKVIPRFAKYANLWGALPEFFRRGLSTGSARIMGALSQGRRINKIGRVGWVDSPVALYALARFNLWPKETNTFYSKEFKEILNAQNPRKDALAVLEETVDNIKDSWRMVTELELKTYMGWRLLRDTDVMSMAHSLEVRVPLIDHKLVEFVCGLPDGWQKNLGHPKRMLTAAVSDIIPPELLNVPKHGFEFPMGHWMRNELKPIVDDALSVETIRKRGLFSPIKLQRLYDSFKNGQLSYPVLWQFVVLELWFRQMES